MSIESQSPAAVSRPSSPLLVVVAWAVVTIPAMWGIAMTGRTAMLLFHPKPAQTSGTAATSAPSTTK